jgi:hypothetical protein
MLKKQTCILTVCDLKSPYSLNPMQPFQLLWDRWSRALDLDRRIMDKQLNISKFLCKLYSSLTPSSTNIKDVRGSKRPPHHTLCDHFQ